MRKTKRFLAAVVALAISIPMAGLVAPPAVGAPIVGEGFVVTSSDLSYILKQIKVAENHVANTTPDTGPCGALLGTGPNQLSSPLLSFGLRTVDGSCNNLVPGQETNGAADQVFPRLAPAIFRTAGPVPAGFGAPGSTSYQQTSGNVFDTEPRVISNLIVDQTSTNPAAVQAAGFPVRSQGNTGVFSCDDPAHLNEPGCVPAHETLFIPNVTTDVGLSPPYNSLFTLFGQFFDHGIDQTVKGGSGTVFVPLKDDDPLVAGPNHQFGDGDDLDPSLRFMVLTRGTNQPGEDGVLGTADDIRDTENTDTPWVDQSQTYTSHASHQAFLREYVADGSGRPLATGKLLGGPAAGAGVDTGMATWATTKQQARDLLGLDLQDKDAVNIPMLAADAYGNFKPGPNGLPQYVTASGLVEGNLGAPVPVPADVLYFDTPFLTDIAHNADPKPGLVPDDDNVASADFASQPAGTYDDEMLDAHFIAGDGRVNENIGLTAIHQVFHSEHDRLVTEINGIIQATPALKSAYEATSATTFKYGERLFQAARFVTEMEYQHLVFEEFVRKVQPAVNPFEPFAFTQTDLNPAIRAEFAHAVYRFGHSMLTETISRTNEGKPGPDNVMGTSDDIAGTTNDISLLDGFLNPPSYFDDGDGNAATQLTADKAAGSIIMGMSDQVGNELDEFVTDTLRNNLLGLPLDLATVNMTRARSEGVPPLNVFRRQVFAATNDGQLTPYQSWVDFGENLKHPESLVNFVAAYGQHPSILTNFGPDGVAGGGNDGPATLESRRAAATRIVNPIAEDPIDPPVDAAAFMNSVGAWANNGTSSITGLDSVDLWVGGLAEITTPFGGLLGTTFNFVFENQMADLQNGDRLYYLARTPGMNLRAQLEGNSFAELMMRNTNANTLKADSFATADCKFQLKNLAGTPAGFASSGNTVADDQQSECEENKILIRLPDGTIQYRQFNSVDPSGINAQAVYNGTAGVDRVRGGNDNDTFWGAEGNDVIEGGSGADIALGGEGNDIITDLAGDDVPKGGPGNDAIDAGPGLDIIMAGDGNDFTNGGANANETFGGIGDDFMILGDAIDAGLGDSGNDWLEGGNQPDLLIGDSSNLFFLDDSQTPGHDIFVGQGGDDDYDMEGGNDVGVSGQGIEKIAGASGYDFEIGQGETVAQDLDLALPIPPLDILQVGVRDKFNEVEALSGWNLNDKIRGDDLVPAAIGGAGFIGCDVLDQAGVDLIAGLDPLLPPLTTPLADVVAASASKDCPILSGPVWGAGNVLLGGRGVDLIEGRGADDVIDGDRYFSVRLSVRAGVDSAGNATGAEIGSASVEGAGQSAMTSQYKRDTNGALTGPTLQQDVFAGVVNPGQIVAVREIVTPTEALDCGTAAPVNCDTALFGGPRASYTITGSLAAGFTVNQVGAPVAPQKTSDAIDTLRNVEKLTFTNANLSTQTIVLVHNAPGTVSAAVGSTAGAATVSWAAPASNTGVTAANGRVTGYQIVATPTSGPAITRTSNSATATTFNFTGLTGGTSYTFQVSAVNQFGAGPLSAASTAVTAVTAPAAPTGLTAVRGNGQAVLSWIPGSDGGSALTKYELQVRTGNTVVRTDTITLTGPLTSTTVTGLTNGTAYNFRLRAFNVVGSSAFSAASAAVTPATVPNAPVIGTPVQGGTNAVLTANAVWTAPPNVGTVLGNGGSAITNYKITAYNAVTGAVVQGPVIFNATIPAGGRAFTFTSTTPVQFEVVATNALGDSVASAKSAPVTPR